MRARPGVCRGGAAALILLAELRSAAKLSKPRSGRPRRQECSTAVSGIVAQVTLDPSEALKLLSLDALGAKHEETDGYEP